MELAADILKLHGWSVDKLWRHYDITGKNCSAFFVSDDKARQYTGLTAEKAWEKFKRDVAQLLTVNPQQPVDKPCSIEVNGELLIAKGKNRNGVTRLPTRAVAEAVGNIPEWCPITKQVRVNGKDLDETIEDGVAYATSRQLAAALNLQVDWVKETETVTLKKE